MGNENWSFKISDRKQSIGVIGLVSEWDRMVAVLEGH